MRNLRKLFIIALGATALSPLVAAQSHPRALSGIVRDRLNHPVRGAIVQLEDENTNGVETFISDADGHYDFKRVSSDIDYRLSATYNGHRSKSREISKFSSKTASSIILHIR